MIALATQCLGALGYLHQQGYLHRDISPDNLMLTRSYDGSRWSSLIDLGLAKRLTSGLKLTSSGMFLGKARYASPEQFGNVTGTPDPRSDLYSFGVVLYQLLTGQCPIPGSSFEELAASLLFRPVIGFGETDPAGRVPEELRRVVLRALEKNPDQRMASADEFTRRLAPFRPEEVPSFDELAKIYGRPGDFSPLDDSERTPTAETRLDGRLDPAGVSPGGIAPPGEAPAVETVGPLSEIPPTEPHHATRGEERPAAGRSRRLGWVAAFAALALIAVLAARLPRTAAPGVEPAAGRAAAGSLLIQAVPWARIVSVTDAEGNPMPLDGTIYTPRLLSLPTGTYAVALSHPDFPPRRARPGERPGAGLRAEDGRDRLALCRRLLRRGRAALGPRAGR